MPVFSYEVGAIFTIEDRGTFVLERMGESFAALDAKITGIQDRLATFGKGEGLFGGVLAGIGEVGAAIEGLAAKATAMAEAMERAFSRSAAAATAAAREMSAAADSMGTAAERMAGTGAGGDGAAFDEGSYLALPYRGQRGGGASERGGLPAPYYGYPRSRIDDEPEQLRLGGPRGPGGGAGGGGGFGRGGGYLGGTHGPDAPFNERPNLNYPVGGRGHGHVAALVEGIAVYEAMKAGASEEQSIDIALLRGFNLDPRTATDAQKNSLRELAARAAEGTSFSQTEVAGGMSVLAAPLGFTGEQGMKDFTGIFEVAAKAAEAAKQLKFGTFEGSLAGGVEFAHQMRAYKPEELAPAMNLLGKITETLPHGDMEREALVMGYVVPQARALGADPTEAMTAVGFLQQSGLQNTVAATTLRQMLIGQMKAGGPMGAHLESSKRALQHDMRELESSLSLKPGALGHVGGSAKESEHVKALHDLGLTDSKGNLQDMNKEGGVDINRMMTLLAQSREKMTPVEFGKALYGAFGVRGETGGAIIADALPQYQAYQARIGAMPNLDEQLKMIQGNAVQLTGQALARTADLGNEIGTTLLPSLKKFDEAIIATTGFLKGLVTGHPEATAAVVGGGIAASIIGGIMAMRGMAGKLGHFFAEGSSERGGAGLRAVGAELGGGGIGPRAISAAPGLTGLASSLVVGTGAELATNWFLGSLADKLTDSVFGKGTAEKWAKEEIEAKRRFALNPEIVAGPHVPTWGLGPRLSGTPRSDPLSSGEPRAAANVTVTLGPVTMQGVPDDSSLHALLKKLTDGLRDALSHMTSDAHGPDMSMYTQPGPF